MGVFGKDIFYYDQVSSTFDTLLTYEAKEGLTVVANKQTGGVGRNGREWLSKEGGLYFSFYVTPQGDVADIPFLAIVCAVACYRTLKKYADCKIKWPNDIVYEGKKLCGILIKSVLQGDNFFAMSGIGVNVNNSDFADLDYRATSLKLITGSEYSKDKLLSEFFEEFERVYQLPRKDIISEYKSACVTLGSDVTVHYNDGSDMLKGKCIDICEDGTLNIETEGKIINVNSGEVSVRGIYGYI